jgi:hypothetical protein
MHTKFWSENLEEKDHSEYLKLIWKDNIRVDLREIAWIIVYWIRWAQDKDHCRAF